MRDYGKCVAHPIVVGGWGQQKGTDSRGVEGIHIKPIYTHEWTVDIELVILAYDCLPIITPGLF
jgi:hypothetical protein